ncbi:MAG TPA: helix-turn-helix transcriptional regulator [Ktedonobacteraceae bacterium]|nr:helix-turn-helix transcriptional regulator [Ktedonobacteraceae bacterium]
MNLAEKLKHLRAVEGELRGFNRPMTQTEVVKTMQEELHVSISQAYLSQLEAGKRIHLTASSRDLLADFFKVHPGYLVSDPPDYQTDLMTDVENHRDRLGMWIISSAEEWRGEADIQQFFQHLASVDDPRRYLALFEQLLYLSAEQLAALVEALFPDEQNGHH